MSKKDILNFMDSDEVSEIDGLKLIKSQSYAHIVPERERDLRKTSSYSKISLLAPDFANKNAKSMRSLSRERSEEESEDISERSHETPEERKRRRQLRRQAREKDLLALPIREASLVKNLLPKVKRRDPFDIVKTPERPKIKEDDSSESRHSSTHNSRDNSRDNSIDESSVSIGGTIKKKRKPRTSFGKEMEEISESSKSKSGLIPLNSLKTPDDGVSSTENPDKEKPHTKDEIKAMTEGFIVVPRAAWDKVEPGSCIKWVNKHGRCIKKEWFCWYHKTSKVTGTNFFYVGSYPSKAASKFQKSFAVFWDNIKMLFMKEDPVTKLLRSAIDTKQDYITDMAIFLKSKYGDEFDAHMKNRAGHRLKKRKEELAAEKQKADEQAKKAKELFDKKKTAKEHSKTADPKASKTRSRSRSKSKTKKTSKTPKKSIFTKNKFVNKKE